MPILTTSSTGDLLLRPLRWVGESNRVLQVTVLIPCIAVAADKKPFEWPRGRH